MPFTVVALIAAAITAHTVPWPPPEPQAPCPVGADDIRRASG
ncbi:hypothetical protein ACFFMN_05945 [Planobispora siamensis]|nr:hypothetical protein [Planobispora siamensis]